MKTKILIIGMFVFVSSVLKAQQNKTTIYEDENIKINIFQNTEKIDSKLLVWEEREYLNKSYGIESVSKFIELCYEYGEKEKAKLWLNFYSEKTAYLYDINSKKYLQLRTIYYTKDRQFIDKYEYKNENWDSIAPETVMELIFNYIEKQVLKR